MTRRTQLTYFLLLTLAVGRIRHESTASWPSFAPGTVIPLSGDSSMYTRFSTPSQTFLFAPGDWLQYSPTEPGAPFIGMLGGAYEFETQQSVGSVIHEASLLLANLQDSMSHAAKFVSELQRLIAFLQDSGSDSVTLYTYEDPPTLEELLAADAEGFGADDWAMEEVNKRGHAIIPELSAVLADPTKHQCHVSAVRLLLFCFPGVESRKLVEQFIESPGDTNEKRSAAMLLAATSKGDANQGGRI